MPFLSGRLISRNCKLSIVAFRTEDAAETTQHTAVVIGLDFYRFGACCSIEGF